MLFEVNQLENDRLLLEEEQRRQSLLDQAVRSFAPHLEGKSDVKAVHLYSTNAVLRKTLREAFSGSKTVLVEHCTTDGKTRKGVNEVQHEGVYIPIPPTADLVVTKTSLNSKIEWFAATLGALTVVLPEGLPYLHKRLERTNVLVLVGAEQGKK